MILSEMASRRLVTFQKNEEICMVLIMFLFETKASG